MRSHFSNKEEETRPARLVHQHCQHPRRTRCSGYRLLNLDDPDFMSCTDRHMQQFADLAATTGSGVGKYVVHVEGHPGWADRVTPLSGMLVLPGQRRPRVSNPVEPWLHYVPVVPC